MKKIGFIFLLSFLTTLTANAGWWEKTKEKSKDLAGAVKEKSVSAYESSKDYVNENKDGWKESTKNAYQKSKEAVKKLAD